MKVKNLLFIISFFTLASFSQAQESFRPHNRTGRERRRPPEEIIKLMESRDFELYGIRTSKTDSNLLILDFKFNKPISYNSISEKNFLINYEPVNIKHIGFSKDGRNFRIFIANPSTEKFSLKVSDIKSFDNETMSPVFVDGIETESVIHLRRKK